MKPIEIQQLTKRFGQQSVLDGINLTLKPETIYALLGRNGAGKSTLFNIIANRIPQTAGTVTIEGQPISNNDQVLNRLYLMSEVNLYPPRMRVDEVFKTTAALYQGFDFDFADRMVNEFGLNTKTRFNKLSTGYRSILKLIVALAVDVDYVFLDEPTLGLDANHRELFYSLLMETYAERPRTFVISTHLIEEIANLVEQVLVLQNGQLTVNDTAEHLSQLGLAVTGPVADVQTYTAGLNVIGHEALGKLRVDYIYGELNEQREIPDTVSISHLDLQKLFIYLTSQEVVNQ
ncbi:ABC transporter ATP-binding protein [Secundilactobacillus muriivasis]